MDDYLTNNDCNSNSFVAMIKTIFKDTFTIDLRALGFFRIILGLVLIFFLYNYLLDAGEFYSDNGVMTRHDIINLYNGWPLNFRFSLFLLNGEKEFIIFVILLQILSAIAFTIGYKTKLNCFISWILILSLQNRNYVVMSGFDLYIRILLFWAFFLPIHAKYSLDSLRSTKVFSNKYFSPATICIFIQIVLFYFFSSILKNYEPWWQQQIPLNFALYNDMLLTEFGYFIKGLFSQSFLQFAALIVLLIEFLTPFMLLTPIFRDKIRIFWVTILMLMHAAFRVFLYIGPFSYVSMAAIVLFLPCVFWDKLETYFTRLKSQHPKFLSLKYFTSINKILYKIAPNSELTLYPGSMTHGFALCFLALTIYINIASYKSELFRQNKFIYQTAEIFGLDQRWDMFFNPPRYSMYLQFYALDDTNQKEYPIWPADNSHFLATNTREFIGKLRNNWWWKYFTSMGLPHPNYNYYREDALIRYMCKKENSEQNHNKVDRIKILYKWQYQLYDKDNNPSAATQLAAEDGWYHIQRC